ncbi:conserved hypothetical protein [Mycobacterium ulcerans Agy99]|uniref:Antitoxin VbhA domain-containing protein n=1 Tax=Mycobacterium ulcerans (strain Agy99) TaxID=362242 RepID=A0PV79_MYCUA|nr:conserved hypothetical protein [Mycobacterium ulcerans Agy99]
MSALSTMLVRPAKSDEVFVQVTELQKAKRRIGTVRATRRNTELEGTRSTAATRADQDDYARGKITAAELGERVRRRYNIQ